MTDSPKRPRSVNTFACPIFASLARTRRFRGGGGGGHRVSPLFLQQATKHIPWQHRCRIGMCGAVKEPMHARTRTHQRNSGKGQGAVRQCCHLRSGKRPPRKGEAASLFIRTPCMNERAYGGKGDSLHPCRRSSRSYFLNPACDVGVSGKKYLD